jgi:uncharacterized protein
MSFEFRAHHFLCAFCFKGSGYSSEFIKNFTAIMQQLNAPDGDNILLHVVDETDSICAPCPHRLDKLCESQTKIMQLDKAHASVLGLTPGDKITWGEAKQRILKQMTLEKFHRICQGCEWKSLGICEDTLKVSGVI